MSIQRLIELTNSNTFIQISSASLIIILFGVSGFILEKLVQKKVLTFVKKTKWKFDDYLYSSLKGLLVPISFLIGVALIPYIFEFSEQFILNLHKYIKVAAILLFTIAFARFIGLLVKSFINRDSASLPALSLISYISRIVVYILGLLIILQSMGVTIAPLLTALGVGGLAVALALQDTLSNLFSGIHIFLTRQVKPGDYVKIDSGLEGYIIDITWRNTVIRSLQNNYHIIPNSKFAQSMVTNFNLPDPSLSVPIEIGIHYQSNLDMVEKVALESARNVMKTTPGGMKNMEPVFRFTNFADSSIQFVIVLYAESFVDQYLLKSVFIKELALQFRSHNIEIPYPIRTVYLKQELECPLENSK